MNNRPASSQYEVVPAGSAQREGKVVITTATDVRYVGNFPGRPSDKGGCMETPKVRDMMIPVSEYVVIEEGGVLTDAFVALEEFSRDKGKARPHRDVLIAREGVVVAKLTMLDMFKAFEPKYEHVDPARYQGRTLTTELVEKLISEFGLWAEEGTPLCQKAGTCKISEAMHLPEQAEFVEEDDSVQLALHRYILGVHQPLLVRKNGTVTGVLRLGDVFNFLRNQMMECAAE